MSCWNCHESAADAGDSCPACGKLQPPRTGDYFELLGLPRRWHLDAETLAGILRDRSRRLHPDRFARADARERALSLQHTTLLNDAVRTLRDPVRRAEYLLSLHGLKAGGADRERAAMEPAFLMAMMETREELAEAKAAGDRAALGRIGAGAKTERERRLAAADRAFARWEENPSDVGPLKEVVALLDEMRYFEQVAAEAEGSPAGG